MQIYDYIPVVLATGGFIAVLDDLSEGYIYRYKPIRFFLTACIAVLFTAVCFFLPVFLSVFMVCGVIYLAEILYEIRCFFVYGKGFKNTDNGRQTDFSTIDKDRKNIRDFHEKTSWTVLPAKGNASSVQLPFYSRTYTGQADVYMAGKREEKEFSNEKGVFRKKA